MSSEPEPGREAPLRDALFHCLVDDAALFPPGSATVPDALAAHRRLRESDLAGYVGPLLVPVSALARLTELLADDGDELSVGLIAPPADVAALLAALDTAAGCPRLRVVGIEIALGDVDPANMLRRLAGPLDAGIGVALEVGRGDAPQAVHRLAAARRLVAAPAGIRGKYRTGGVDPGATPSEAELAAVLSAAVQAQLPMKLTAGLHHAVRTAAQHGVLNVLAAVASVQSGGRPAADLAERDAGKLAQRCRQLTPAQVAAARTIFTGFGCCGVLEPLAEAAALGLLPDSPQLRSLPVDSVPVASLPVASEPVASAPVASVPLASLPVAAGRQDTA